MAEIWMAATGLALGAATTGLSLSGAMNPSQPNLSSSSRQISDSQALLLPIQRQLEALAQSGGSGWIDLPSGYNGGSNQSNQQMVWLSNPTSTTSPTSGRNGRGGVQPNRGGTSPNSGQWIAYNPADWASGGKYNVNGDVTPKFDTHKAGGNRDQKSNRMWVDFTGMSQSDIQAKLSEQTAKLGLEMSKKYDPQFIDEALKEEALANPAGVAARKREYELIQEQMANHPQNPIASELQDQIGQRVSAGKGLDDFDTHVLNSSVEQALKARGSDGAGADFTSPLTTGFEGNQRQIEGIGEGQQFLGSGTTPEDVKYRQEQQDLANLSAFMQGRTPESEFGSMSGAQKGATPMNYGTPLPTTGGNPVATASGASSATFGQMAQQGNPWFQGLSSAISAGNAIGNGIYAQNH